MQAEHQHAIFGLRPVERGFQREAAIAGLELVLEGARVLEQACDFTSCTVSATCQNHRSASGNARCSACALATETSRSLLVPPKRMVIRISPAFVIPGMRSRPANLEIPLEFAHAPRNDMESRSA